MTAQVQGDKTRTGLRRMSASIVEASRAVLFSAVTAAQQSAASTTLFKDQTGATRQSIRATVLGDSGQVVARGAASVLENGTRAHDIVARSGGMLRFFVNGQAVFRRRVHHPGTGPRPFMAQALFHAETVVAYAAEVYVNEAIARA